MAKVGIAINCIEDVITKITQVPMIFNKVFHVYSESDLLDESKHIKKPCIGILYEGLNSVPDGTGKGLTTDLALALAVVIESKDIGNLNRKDAAIELLDDMRDTLKVTCSPSGYPWRFVGENPAGVLGNHLAYVQRWATRVILTAQARQELKKVGT